MGKNGTILKTVGSVCSGIEAASVAWKPLGYKFEWFSEIESFPSEVLNNRYPYVPNIGDMTEIPNKIIKGVIASPDIICGGTPCQAFSLAGWQNGLNDSRGNLTLKFVNIIDANDKVRLSNGQSRTVVFWENVEGVLSDKTNAFGCLISSLAGVNYTMKVKRWSNAGIVYGKKRNVAWRVLDAKFFGLPQQRRRLYLLAGGKDFHPENVLFSKKGHEFKEYPHTDLNFRKDGHDFQVFREYTDCLYASYGTKWNGNAAANNGSLFVVQDGRIRRFSPLECERLMGFPDNYTAIDGSSRTSRYKAIGNSWAVPVVNEIGSRFLLGFQSSDIVTGGINRLKTDLGNGCFLCYVDDEIIKTDIDDIYNCSIMPENIKFGNIKDIIAADATEKIYISPVGCYGILRRGKERNNKLNPELSMVLKRISQQMPIAEIEERSLVQKRGRLGTATISA